MSVLPDDIRGFAGVVDLDVTAQEISPFLEFIIIVDDLVVVFGSVEAFFRLERQESSHWTADVLVVLLLVGFDLVIAFTHLVELQIFDGRTSYFEQINHCSIVERK